MYMNRLYLLLPILVLTASCFKKPEQEKMAVATTVALAPVYAGASGSYLTAQGPCKGNTALVFEYSSAVSSTQTVEVKCTYDYVNTNLPVANGLSNQIFTVAVSGKYQNKKSSATSQTVNFNPAPSPDAGQAITSAGGQTTGPFASTWSIVGEFFGGTTLQTDPNATHRPGLSGVLDP